MAVIKTSKNRGRRGRPPKNDPQTQWTIRVPSSIAEQWNMILYDPLLGRSKLGLRQFIIAELMKGLLEAWQESRDSIPVAHILARVAKELTDMEDENQQAPRDP